MHTPLTTHCIHAALTSVSVSRAGCFACIREPESPLSRLLDAQATEDAEKEESSGTSKSAGSSGSSVRGKLERDNDEEEGIRRRARDSTEQSPSRRYCCHCWWRGAL